MGRQQRLSGRLHLPQRRDTVVDAGTRAGATFPISRAHHRSVPDPRAGASQHRRRGMGGGTVEQNIDDMDPRPRPNEAMKNKNTCVGIKTAHFRRRNGSPWSAPWKPAQMANVPFMVDFGTSAGASVPGSGRSSSCVPATSTRTSISGAVPMLDDHGKVCPICSKRGSAA